MLNEQLVLKRRCTKKRVSSVLIWMVGIRLRVLPSVNRQQWGWVGAMLLLITCPIHRRGIRLVVISKMISTWSTIHSQLPPNHAAALKNAPAPSSAHLVPSKTKKTRLRAKRVVRIHTVLLVNPVVTILLPLAQQARTPQEQLHVQPVL